MPLAPGSSRGIVGRNIEEMQAAGHPHRVAVAAALSNADRHPRAARGGIVGYQDGGAPSPEFLPTSITQNPLEQSAISQLSQIPTEKLRELALSGAGGPQQGIVQRLLAQRQMMPGSGPQPQPFTSPAAMPAMQGGGDVPWTEDASMAGHIARHGVTGFIHSPIPGRTDLINAQVPVGSYVIPADIISGIGEGNSAAGAAQLQRAMSIGPFGTPIPPRRGGGVGIPRPPGRFTEPIVGPAAAKGGKVKEQEGDPTPILAAGGEMIVPPHIVRAWGGGDLKRGHDVLDAWVVKKRKEIANKMLKLPPPKKK